MRLHPRLHILQCIKQLVVIAFITVLFSYSTGYCDTYFVALEPLPPFINKGFVKNNDPGLSVELLKKIEKKIGAKFVFAEVPYGRLKLGLKNRLYDLVGHMPYLNEVEEFYTYALDVDWSIDVAMDLYVAKRKFLSNPTRLKIGIPRGNKDFAAEYTGLPLGLFYDKGSIESLLEMLVRGRIDAYWFPRASTVPHLRKMGHKIYYKKLPIKSLPIGFSVPNTERGRKLKAAMEDALQQIETRELFKEIYEFNEMPDEGEIN